MRKSKIKQYRLKRRDIYENQHENLQFLYGGSDACDGASHYGICSKAGNLHKIDVNNPNPNKFYTTIYDEFLVNGGDNMSMLKKSGPDILQKYDFDKDIVTIDYIKTLNQPFEVRSDNRIKVVD